MQALVLASLLVLSGQAVAQLATGFAHITVNWNAGGQLGDGFPLMCDDTAYRGVDLFVPGEYVDYRGRLDARTSITFKDCTADWRLMSQKRVKVNGVDGVKLRFDGGEGSCEVLIRQDVRDNAKSFSLYMSDAC